MHKLNLTVSIEAMLPQAGSGANATVKARRHVA